MSDDDIARRAVACKRWRWMPGMLTKDGIRLERVDPDGYGIGRSAGGYAYTLNADSVPDFSDAATVGCLLYLVREAYGADWLTPARLLGNGATEAEALVAALETLAGGER
jgi:hypothetical protein